MAQDTGASDSTKPQEVDLDELEVVILIIGKNASALNNAGAFLTRRGWPTTVMTNMSKAVEHIAEKKPDFVLVSFNHPNPAVLKLPDLITQTFNLTCVGFVENLDTASQQRLNSFKMRYKIQGSPSGPNLQRSIRKILAEKFNLHQESDRSTEGTRERDSDSGGNVTVKGNSADKGGTIVQSGGKGLAGQKGTTVVRGDAGLAASGESQASGGRLAALQARAGDAALDAAEDGEETDSVSTGKYTMSKKVRKSLKDLAGRNAASEGPANMLQGKSLDGAPGADPDPNANDLVGRLKKSLFGESGQDETSEESASSDAATEAAQKSATDAYYANARRNRSATGSPEDGGHEGEPSATSSAVDFSTGKPSLAQAMAAKNAGEAAGAAPSRTPGSPDMPAQLVEMTPEAIAALPPKKILERAVASALHRICRRTPDTITRELGKLTKVAVFPIESGVTPGYLVVGIEQDPAKIEDFFLKTCEVALREEFEAMKVPATLETGFWVHVPEVHFNIWVHGKADFNVVLPHEEAEVGIGFFPLSGPLPRAQEHGENKEMFAIAIDDISTDQPINFKAYLHLKKNQKYYLYLRNGRQLQPEQKQRLKGRQVQNIFMKSVDVQNLRMFLAASYLRDIIKKPA